MLKELLKKYSLTIEDLTKSGIDFNSISEEELESKIIEAFGTIEESDKDKEIEDNKEKDVKEEDKKDSDSSEGKDEEPEDLDSSLEEYQKKFEKVVALNNKLKGTIKVLEEENEELKEFKIKVEKENHESRAKEIFDNFQLTKEDVEDLDIHSFSLTELEEKCYAILGKKLASNKNFSKNKDSEANIKISIDSDKESNEPKLYGGLFEKYSK